jgi:hypothetical protein
MKLEKPQDVFLYLSKYLHCNFITIDSINEKVYFICPIIQMLNVKKKINHDLYIKTIGIFHSYLEIYSLNFGAFKTEKGGYIFHANKIKQRKAFLKFIYQIEVQHENNTNNGNI